jgi:hypothetical protein
VESSKIYNKNSLYFIQLCRYSIPGDEHEQEKDCGGPQQEKDIMTYKSDMVEEA